MMTYQAKPSICNACPVKADCTSSHHGREISVPTEPWPHSEAARFHRGIVLVLVALAALLAAVTMVRYHQPEDLAVSVVPLVAAGLLGHRFTDHFRRSPAGFPVATVAIGPTRHADQQDALGLGPEGDVMTLGVIAAVLVVVVVVLVVSTRVLREYERGVLFRLGRLRPVAGPGLVLLLPFVDRLIRVDLRTVTLTIPPQEVITRDNVPARVNAVAYFRVVEPILAVTEVEAYPVATSQIAQTTLRSVLGRAELDTLLSERDELNDSLRRIIDEQTEPWGIKVTTVEIKDVEIPEAMQRAMARAAEAERERRAKIISAEGEFQASQKLLEASDVLSRNPAAMQLRYQQTLVELGAEKSTIIFPLPLDLIAPFLTGSQQDPDPS